MRHKQASPDAAISLSRTHRALAAGLAAAPKSRNPRADVASLLRGDCSTGTVDAILAAAEEQRLTMLQPDPLPVAERVRLLRAEMSKRGFAAYLIPHEDECMLEYTPVYAYRLAWVTNFNGSAGASIVMNGEALFVSDGRYRVKAAEQVDHGLFEVEISDYVTKSAIQWLVGKIKAGDKVAYDPRLINLSHLEQYETAVTAAGGEMVACDDNLVDLVWERQPARPLSPIVPHTLEFAGQSWTDKVKNVVASLRSLSVGAALITDPASVAWLFNIRGNDVECTPLPLCSAIVYDSGHTVIFCDQRNLTVALFAHFDGSKVELHPPEYLARFIDALGASGKRVLVDPGTSNSANFARLKEGGADIVIGADPCALPRACKNPVEIAQTRKAHLRDAAAICRMHAWFDRESGKSSLTEMAVVERLVAERLKDSFYVSESFSTIVAAGENSRNVHYVPTTGSDRAIVAGDCVLMDTGAQYCDGGTTDSTRVKVAGGAASDQLRRDFTLVLKGHIAIANQRFPSNCTGARLDSLARSALWNAGMDFDHGVGHGVGSFLSVHEGPHRISYKLADQPLQEGMIVSNEPGAYDADDYGIRLENLLVVCAAADIEGGTRPMRSFDVLTMIPFDRALINERMLTKQEIVWLNTYHALVRSNVAPLLDGADLDWLISATQPIEWH